MRPGVLFFGPVFLVLASALACGDPGRRSGFVSEASPSDPSGGSGLGTSEPIRPEDETSGCASSRTAIERIPLVIEFVVDASGSMDGDGSGSLGHLRWPAARDALLAAFADMNAKADPATFVGLQRFGSTPGPRVLPGPISEGDHYAQLVRTIDTPTGGEGGTGTEAALVAAYAAVEDFTPPPSTGLDAEDVKRVVVLLSDGVPSGSKAACENLVGRKLTSEPSTMTFSIGIGTFPSESGYDPAFMGRLAQRGGTAPAGCDPESSDISRVCHFQVTPGEDVTVMQQALLDAINEIRALSAPCAFAFELNEHTDLAKVEVTLTDSDGTVSSIPRDSEDGWSFDDDGSPKKVVLHGDACAATHGVVAGRVDVVIGCKSAK